MRCPYTINWYWFYYVVEKCRMACRIKYKSRANLSLPEFAVANEPVLYLISILLEITILTQPISHGEKRMALYRPQFLRHLVRAYAALAAGGSCSAGPVATFFRVRFVRELSSAELVSIQL